MPITASRIFFILAVSLSLLAATACTSKTDRGRIDYNFNREQGGIFFEEGDYAEADKRFKLALAGAEKGWGAEHENAAGCLADLGLLYYKQSDFKQAESFYKRALVIRRKNGDSVKVANTLMFIAAALEGQGKIADADRALKEALALREAKVGKDHLDVARNLEFIAASYWKQGKYKDAEPLLERALTIREKKLGRDDQQLLNTMNNLAAIYFRLKKYGPAETLYKRMLAIQEKTLGKDNISLSFTLDSYGQVLRATGRVKEAEPLEQKAGRLRARALGKETKSKLDRFARSVTFHLLDDSYTSYERSQSSLTKTDLAPEVVEQLQKRNLIPASADKLKDRLAMLATNQQTTEVRINEAYPLEPNHHGLVPVRVKGVVTIKSREYAAAKSRQFDIELLIGLNKQTSEPMVAMLTGYPPFDPKQTESADQPTEHGSRSRSLEATDKQTDLAAKSAAISASPTDTGTKPPATAGKKQPASAR
jgi:tetratricopeptide (TPR) repeat protein